MADAGASVRVLGLILIPFLLVSPVYAASSSSGSTSTYPGEIGSFCHVSVNGQISGTQVGGATVVIQIPYLPTVGCLSDTSVYQIPTVPVAGAPSFSCAGLSLNPLSWGGVIACISGYISALISWLPSYIIGTISNFLIVGFNEVYGALWYAFVYVGNVIISVLNVIIVSVDTVPLGLGGILLDSVLSIGEPWSAFLTPVIWFAVVALIVLMLIAVLFVARAVVKALKKTAEIGVEAA